MRTLDDPAPAVSHNDLPAYLLEVGVEACADSIRAADGISEAHRSIDMFQPRLHHAVQVTPQFDGSYHFQIARVFRGRRYAEIRGVLREQGRASTLFEVQAQSNHFFQALFAALARNRRLILQFVAFAILAAVLRQPWASYPRGSASAVSATVSFMLFVGGFFFAAGILIPCIVIAASEPKRIVRYFRDRILADAAQAARAARKNSSTAPRPRL